MQGHDNPFERITRSKDLMINAVNTLFTLGQAFAPLVPQLVALVIDTAEKIKVKVPEIQLELDKLMRIVDVAQQVIFWDPDFLLDILC